MAQLTPEQDPPHSLVAVVEELQRTHRGHDWAGMRLCFHDEALIESVAAGKVLGPDETIDAIQAAVRDGIYAMNEWEIEQLWPDVILAWAGVRHRPDGSKRVSDTRIYWLVVGRDGVMWRVRIFHDRETALAVLDEHGHGLGL